MRGRRKTAALGASRSVALADRLAANRQAILRWAAFGCREKRSQWLEIVAVLVPVDARGRPREANRAGHYYR